MKRLIWKYDVYPEHFDHMMPQGARFLSLQMQGGEPRMWFEVDPDYPQERIGFITVPTGLTPVPHGAIYLGTFQPTPELVFHTYKLQRR